MTKRILLVDDERDVLFGMHEYFSALSFAVDCATELEEAQALVSHVQYSAVIADMRLTGSHGAEGLDVIALVRETNPDAGILLLTAFGSPELTNEAKRRGVNAVLQKPRPLEEIARVVQSLIDNTT